jgi:hypothetical protein
MTLAQAVDRVGTWTITGWTNLGMDDISGAPAQQILPAMLLLPGIIPKNPTQAFDIGLSSAAVVVAMDHIVFSSGIALKRPQARTYDQIALVDAYIAKVKTDWLLNGYLLEPMQFTVSFDNIVFGGQIYTGITFNHRWVLAL